MIYGQCPFGELVQTDLFIWMVECSINNCLVARENECYFSETIQEKGV